MLAQYIKDLSFENPSAPKSLQGPGQNPQLKVSVNVNASPRGEDTYEVALQLEVHASSDDGVIYNVELIYGGLFRLRGLPQNMLQPVLFVDCPTILFPFLRRVLADVIRDGGFPPLMLDPIDFGRLYTQNSRPDPRRSSAPGEELGRVLIILAAAQALRCPLSGGKPSWNGAVKGSPLMTQSGHNTRRPIRFKDVLGSV